MDLSNLPKVKNIRSAKRIGRGESSGKGKNAGKGSKGQKVRGSIRLGFEGGQLPLIKRLPFRRGIGNRPAKNKLTITLDQLKVFEDGAQVNLDTLVTIGLLNKADNPKIVRIVAKGSIEKALKIDLSITEKAKKLVEKVGGEVVKGAKEKVNA